MTSIKQLSVRNLAGKIRAIEMRTIQGLVVLAIFGSLLGNVAINFWEDRPLPPSHPQYLNKERLLRLSDNGDAEAQYLLGNLYFAGHTVKASEQEATHWYTLAAKQGHPLAQYQLGLILQLNNDDDGALLWLRKAADQNVIDAQNRVGNLFIKGTTGSPSNGAIAAKYFATAAEQGNSTAMHNLAHLLKNGAGIAQDDIGALFWMKLATRTEREPKVRTQMLGTLTEWEQSAKPETLAAAEQAAVDRLAKGFKQKPLAGTTVETTAPASK